MAMIRQIASKCRFNHMNMLISRRDSSGLPYNAKSIFTSKPCRVRFRCRMLFEKNLNRSKFGVNVFSFNDSRSRNGIPWHFHSSSAAFHSDRPSDTTKNYSRPRPVKRKGRGRFGVQSKKFVADLKKRINLLLSEDVSSKTKSLTTRLNFHDAIHRLTKVKHPWSAHAADRLLRKMWAWDTRRADKTHLKPITETYNAIIALCALMIDIKVRRKSIGYLKELEDIHKKTKDPQLRPKTSSYNACLQSFRRAYDREEAMEAEKMLKRMQTIDDVYVNTKSMNAVIAAWSHCSAKDGVERAERLLEEMQSLYAAGNIFLKPKHRSFEPILTAYADRGDVDRVEAIIGRMEELSRSSEEHKDLRPITATYNILLKAHQYSQDKGLAEKAEELLAKMMERHKRGDAGVRPDSRSFNTVMKCHAKFGDIAKVKRGIDALDALSRETGDIDLRPSNHAYTALIIAYANSNQIDAAEKAEMYIKRMEKLHKSGSGVKPNGFIYNALMQCYARDGNAAKVENIIKKLNIAREGGNDRLRPTLTSYVAVLEAYANSDKDCALEKAEATMAFIQKKYFFVGVSAFNVLMKAYARTGDAAKVESIIADLKNESSKERHDHLCPNLVSYNTLLNAYANSLDDDASKKAEMVLKEIKDLGDTNVEPNIFTYNALMLSYAKCGDAAKVESMISALEENSIEGGKKDLIPNTATYNTLIEALAKSDEKDAPEKAEATLEKMQSLHERGDVDVEPNISSFNFVLACHARNGKARHAEAIVNHVENLHVQTQFEHIRPNTETYNILIDAWVNSGDDSGVDNAESILVKMKELQDQGYNSAAPDLETYSSIANAYKNSKKDLPSCLTNEFEMLKNGE